MIYRVSVSIAVLLALLFFVSCDPGRTVGAAGVQIGKDDSVQTYDYPLEQPRSQIYQVWVNGRQIDVLATSQIDFAAFECIGPVRVEIKSSLPFKKASVKPTTRRIQPVVEGQSVRFDLDGPQNVSVNLSGLRELYLFANPKEKARPSPGGANVHYFKAGRIYEVGELKLKSGETLYIEGGAVVKGSVRVIDASDVKIQGYGIFDGSFYDYQKGKRVRSILFETSWNLRVEGIIMIEPSSWMLVFGACQDVYVNNVKQIGLVVSSDGIDICGSQNVLVENCFLRNDDDNIAIKALSYENHPGWQGNVSNVRVQHCVFLNGAPGNSMEIGFELRSESVRDVVFEDIDVIYCQADGAVMSIHNGDRATVENVRWENIRVEHYWARLIDFRVMKSQYSKDNERGRIRNIHLKNIHVVKTPANASTSISVMGGFSPDKPLENVLIEDLYFNGEKVMSADQLDLFTRNMRGLEFR